MHVPSRSVIKAGILFEVASYMPEAGNAMQERIAEQIMVQLDEWKRLAERLQKADKQKHA